MVTSSLIEQYLVDYMEGIVELALERAERDDSKLLALIAYKNHSGESDIFTQEAFVRRSVLSLLTLLCSSCYHS